MNDIIDEKEFKGIDFSVEKFQKADYEYCRFKGCNFGAVDLSNISFTSCEFLDCDMSSAKILHTSFKEATFKTCKLLGLHFDQCHTFLLAMDFSGCQLDLSSFYQLSLKKIKFDDCSLKEVDFVETDLTESHFTNCDLTGAIFENSILNKADLRTSFGYIIDPEINQISKMRLSAAGLSGLLSKHGLRIE